MWVHPHTQKNNHSLAKYRHIIDTSKYFGALFKSLDVKDESFTLKTMGQSSFTQGISFFHTETGFSSADCALSSN